MKQVHLQLILFAFTTLLLPEVCLAFSEEVGYRTADKGGVVMARQDGGLGASERAEAKGDRRRLRDLGIAIGSLPTGPNNAITDVEGVLVGHTTLISGTGALQPGKGPVRTGVT